MTDQHAITKAASMSTVEECLGWIEACRARSDEAMAQLGITRKLELQGGRK